MTGGDDWLRTPPHSHMAEQSVLGGLLISNSAWGVVSAVLDAADFYSPQHQVIFETIGTLIDKGRPADVVTVSADLAASERLDLAGGLAYLAEIAGSTPSIANIEAYAVAVADRATQRAMIVAGYSIADSAFAMSGRTVAELLDEAQARIMGLGRRRPGVAGRMGQLLKQAVDRIDELFNSDADEVIGITTGFAAIDRRIMGLQPGHMIVIGGRPAMGKTAFAMNVVTKAAAAQSRPVLVFSMEMSAEQLTRRMLASAGGIPLRRIVSGKLLEDDWPKLSAAVHQLHTIPLVIDDESHTLSQIRSAARLHHYQTGVGAIMVDYLQLIDGGGDESRNDTIGAISRGFKRLGMELGCPVIVLSQLSRKVEERPNKRPRLSDLRESGSIEQDADIVMFVYRDEYYREDSPDRGVAEIITAKARDAEIGTDRLRARLDISRFEDLPAGYESPAPGQGNGAGKQEGWGYDL